LLKNSKTRAMSKRFDHNLLPFYENGGLFYPVYFLTDKEEGERRVKEILKADELLAIRHHALNVPQNLLYYNFAVELISKYKLDASKFFPAK
jgi:hypothetical protein